MDALEILRQWHVEAESAFRNIEHASPGDRAGLWAKLRPDLELHEKVEERFVYDPMKQDVGSGHQMLLDLHERHHRQVGDAESMIHQIGQMDAHDSRWLETVMQLRTMLKQHIDMEQDEFWPRIREVWGEDHLQDAGGKVQAAKTTGSIGSAVSGAVGQAADAIKDTASRITGGQHEEHAA